MKPVLVVALMLTTLPALAEDPVVYTGCIGTLKGDLYAVRQGTTPKQPCTGGDSQISWNQAGVQGPAGPAAPAGGTQEPLQMVSPATGAFSGGGGNITEWTSQASVPANCVDKYLVIEQVAAHLEVRSNSQVTPEISLFTNNYEAWENEFHNPGPNPPQLKPTEFVPLPLQQPLKRGEFWDYYLFERVKLRYPPSTRTFKLRSRSLGTNGHGHTWSLSGYCVGAP